MDFHSIAGTGLQARIKADGAELCSLRTRPSDEEMLWQALPAWPQHAPVLFPIVGTLKDNRYRHGGRTYELGRHGFARHRRFAWAERSADACRLVLTDDAATLAAYPFAFRFEVAYAMIGPSLRITYSVTNTGTDILPASMGAHPAFNWPLRPGIAKDAHALVFADPEPAPIRRIDAAGLLQAGTFPSPIEDRRLALHEGLFAADAIIMDRPASRAVRFSAPGAPAVELSWEGFAELGIWMRPGADFLCIEPWCGTSSPASFDGEIMDKPGMMLIPPGGRREAWHMIRVA